MIEETETARHPGYTDPEYVQPIIDGVRRIFGEGLASLATAADLDELMDQIYAFSEGVYEDLMVRYPVEHAIDCAPGCSFCCSNNEVHLSPPEALRIASFVFAGESRRAAADAHQKALATTASKDESIREAGPNGDRKLFPCPLLDLETGNCGIYPVRPLVCRSQNSVDKRVCETRLRKGTEEGALIVGGFHQRAGVQAILKGIRLAMMDAGHEDQVLDLTRSLAILLKDEGTLESALHDDSVLEPARGRTVR